MLYRNTKTKELVFEEDARDYALTQLGLMQDGDLCIKYRGKNGEHTLEQLDMLDMLVEWYFDDWEKVIEPEDNGNVFEMINEQSYYDDIWRREKGYDI